MILLAWLAACSPPDDPAPARKKAPEPVVEVSEHTTPVLPTQPIDTDTAELTDTAERLGQGEWSARAPALPQLEPLPSAFNRMAEML